MFSAIVHVQRDCCVAKFRLEPVVLARSKRFTAQGLTQIEKIVREHEEEFMEAWNGFFSS